MSGDIRAPFYIGVLRCLCDTMNIGHFFEAASKSSKLLSGGDVNFLVRLSLLPHPPAFALLIDNARPPEITGRPHLDLPLVATLHRAAYDVRAVAFADIWCFNAF